MEKNENKGRIKMLRKVKRQMKSVIEGVALRKKQKMLFKQEFQGGGYDRNEVNLLLLAHSLEKGMGINNPRRGFGIEKATRLINEISIYVARVKHPITGYAYNEAMSVLGEYIQFTVNSGVDISSLIDVYQRILEQYGIKRVNAGYTEIDVDALYNSIDFQSALHFMESRHSIRSFEKRPVSEVEMEKVLETASFAPSACNRQPIKVFWTNNSNSVLQISKCVPGNKGFEDDIPNWAIVAVDRTMFGEQEVLQWYVNGGIYVSHLVLAFHAYKLGSCIFQIPIGTDCAKDIQKVEDIPNQYAIVCAVGYGYPQHMVKCLAAARKPVSDYEVYF